MALYNEAFTSRAKTIMRCSFCLFDTHISVECPYAPVEVKTPEARLSPQGKMGRPPIWQSTKGPAGPQVAICASGAGAPTLLLSVAISGAVGAGLVHLRCR